MKAIILAAGYATRLYPLTLNKPKAFLEVAGKQILHHIMDKLDDVEIIDEIHIVTNDKFHNSFIDWANNFKSNKKITVTNDGTKTNEDRLGAVGDIHHVIKKYKLDDDLIIIGSDNLFEFSLKDFVNFSIEKNSSAIAARDLKEKSAVAKKFGVVELDENNKIINFHEKPEDPVSTLASTCCYFLKKDDVQEVENCILEKNGVDNTGEFVKYLAKKKGAHSFVFDEKWFDIGSHENLKEANEIYKSIK